MGDSKQSMQESAAESTSITTEEAVGSAAERNIILWLTNVSHGVNHFQNQMMVVLYPVIMPELGFGYAELGLLLAVQSMLSGATQGFYGFATPFLPRTWLLGIGNLVLGLGTLATGFVNSFGGIVATRGVASVGASAQHPVGYSMLAGYFPNARGKIIGLNSSISNVGSLLAPLTAGAMLVIMGWRQVFMIVASLSIAMGLIYFLFRKRVDPATSQASTSREKLSQSTSSYLRVFRNKNMILVSLVMMVGGAGRGGGGMVAFMAVYFATDLGLSTFMVAVAITTLGLGGVIGPIGFGWLSDRLSRTGILQLSLGLSALATVWVAFQGAFLPLLLLSLVLYGTVTRSRMTLTQAIVADSLPDADRDAAFSAFFFLGFASGPVWLLVVGSLMQTLGFSVAFSVLAVSYLAGMLLMLFVTDTRKSAKAQLRT
jgi:MFS family permease